MTTVHVTDIEWEPQDESISEEEFEALLEETPDELDIEVDSVEGFEANPASYLDTDELKVRGLKWSVC